MSIPSGKGKRRSGWGVSGYPDTVHERFADDFGGDGIDTGTHAIAKDRSGHLSVVVSCLV